MESSQSSETPTVRKRGKGFPVVPLPEAVQILKRAGASGTSHPVTAFAQYMGHQTTNSGAFKRRLAGMKDWGLITSKGNQVEFTELGKRLAFPPEPSRVQEDLRAAFTRCEIFQRFYERSAKKVPLDEAHLGNAAVLEQGVAPSSKDRFIRSFVESAIAVGFATRSDPGKIVLLPEGQGTSPVVSGEEEGAAPAPDLQSADTPVSLEADSGTIPTVLRLPWEFEDGAVVLEVRLRRPLPPSVFSQIGDITAELEKLADAIAEAERHE